MAAERRRVVRCAIYTRKSSEEGLEQAFNSLEAQGEACQAYVESQRHEGWRALPTRYEDGGYSGGNVERPALRTLLADVEAGRIDTVVVYKVDRLTRSLTDFAKIVETFDKAGVAFVSVTQQFNTTSSMGRLTLNVLLSFAQFEREVTGERIRDKIAASKRKGMWMGGAVPLGYEQHERTLRIIPEEAERVREIFRLYLKLKCVRRLKADLDRRGIRSKRRTSRGGRVSGGMAFSRGALYTILKNRLYCGQISHRDAAYPGQHEAIVPLDLWSAVQALLTVNNQAKRTGTSAQDPSLLAGLLYDDRGQRMTPKHTRKQGKRYRYYVSQAVIQGQARNAGSVATLPAHEVERTVIHQLEHLLTNRQGMLDQVTVPSDDAAIRRALLTGALAWKDLRQCEPATIRAFCLATIRQVTIKETCLDLALSRTGLRTILIRGKETFPVALKLVSDREASEDLLQITVHVVLRRCRGVVRMVIPGDAQASRPARPNATLIKALARAHTWSARLFSGRVSMRMIANENRLHVRYVGRLIRLTFLAPDLVDAILQGRQAPELTLDALLSDLPLEWAAQRTLVLAPKVGTQRLPPLVWKRRKAPK